jgi:hypothetical protein
MAHTRLLIHAQSADDEHVVYVGGLNFDTTEDGLREFVVDAGVTPTNVRILTRPDGKSHGYVRAEVLACQNCCQPFMRLDVNLVWPVLMAVFNARQIWVRSLGQ